MPTLMQNVLSAIERRDSWMREQRAQGTNCFRLLSAEGEGVPGLVLELWNDVLMVHTFENRWKQESELAELLEELTVRLKLKATYRKDFVENRNAVPPALVGNTHFEVSENGLKFEIRPEEKFSVGLFLDQRDNRKKIAALAKGRRVLNLFAYTCGFSVYAAKNGARSVTSVDLSARYLDWGKKNFALNGLAEDKGRWFCGDVFEVLKRFKKKGERFDLLVLDPPTFSRGEKGRIFKIAKDLPELWSVCAEVLEPGATAYLSSNYTGFRYFDRNVREMVGERFAQQIKLPPVPQDFARETEKLHSFCCELNWL